MIPDHIKNKILEKVTSIQQFGMNDLTWDKEEAKTLITSLMPDNIGILGGSVYKIELNNLIPLYDNWYCNPIANETQFEFYTRSKLKALAYIDKYPVHPNETILFSLVFTENIDL